MRKITEVLDHWSQTGEMDQEMALIVLENLDEFIDKQLSVLDSCLRKGDSVGALYIMIQMNCFVSVAGNKVPKIIIKLGSWIPKLQAHTKTLAKKLNANSFSISVGLPFGISVSLSWPV